MRKTELYLAIACAIAIFLKQFHIVGMAIFMVVLFSSLLGLYFYFGLFLLENIPLRKIISKDSYQNMSFARIVGGVFSGIVFAICVTGILFRLMHWPGAKIILFMGIVLVLPVLIYSIIIYSKKRVEYGYQRLIRAAILIALMNVLLFFA